MVQITWRDKRPERITEKIGKNRVWVTQLYNWIVLRKKR
jgi:hypothetical protein